VTYLTLEERPLPIGSIGTRSSGWWAMLFVIITEGAIFVFLQFSYYYIALQQPPAAAWPPSGPPAMDLSLPSTLILLASSATFWWGEHSIKCGSRLWLTLGLLASLVLGAVFVAIQGLEWSHQHFNYATHIYGSLYFTLTGFHIAHVVVGLVIIAALLAWSLLGYFNGARYAAVSTGGLYWHFVDAVWLTLFFTFYIMPRLR